MDCVCKFNKKYSDSKIKTSLLAIFNSVNQCFIFCSVEAGMELRADE